MENGGTVSQKYASFMKMTEIPNNILEKLATNQSQYAENLWKVLKYADMDALSKTNLTFDEKMEIVWSPDKMTSVTTQDDFNVFLKPLMSSALNSDTSQTQLRLYHYDTIAQTQIKSTLVYDFAITTNESSCMVYNENNIKVDRVDLIVAYLVEILNMTDLGIGVNFLRFDRLDGVRCHATQNINNSKSLYGQTLTMALLYMDASLGGVCNG